MRLLARIGALLCVAAPLSANVLLTMKSGERYEAAQPPRHRNGMVSFTTLDKRFLTVKESEIAREETIVPPAPKVKLDRRDDKQLGAIAREQRAERGISADVAGSDDRKSPEAREKEPPEKKPAKKTHRRAHPPPTPPPSPPPPPDSPERR